MFLSLEDQEQEVLEPVIELEMFREYAWDFAKDEPLVVNGDLVVVEGIEALKVWMYNALRTERDRYMAFEGNFGQNFDSIIGSSFTKEAKQSEIRRIVEECLYINPYITGISSFDTKLDGDTLEIEMRIETIYGEVETGV